MRRIPYEQQLDNDIGSTESWKKKRFGTRHPERETPNRIKRRASTPKDGRELQATAIGNQLQMTRPPLCARVTALC